MLIPRFTIAKRIRVGGYGLLLWTLSFLLLLMLAGCGEGGGNGEAIKVVITPVATPTPTPPILPTIAPTTYKVSSGDTLSGIAARFDVSVEELIRANSIADPDRLVEGQELNIPARSQGASGTPLPSPTPVLPPPDITPPLGPTTAPTVEP